MRHELVSISSPRTYCTEKSYGVWAILLGSPVPLVATFDRCYSTEFIIDGPSSSGWTLPRGPSFCGLILYLFLLIPYLRSNRLTTPEYFHPLLPALI